MAALAGAQHGIVSRAQLTALGMGRGAVEHRVAGGRLHPVHRGVYAVGHAALTREGRWLAAVLATGEDAVLSHRSSAALWGIRPTARARVEVCVPRTVRPRPGIEVRRTRLQRDEITVLHGIPVTSVPRTLLDLATVLPLRALTRATEEAERLRLADVRFLDALLARHAGRPGTPALRRVLADARLGATVTHSELEERFLAFLAARHLPPPECNVPVVLPTRRAVLDALWRHAGLVVELDGHASHRTRAAFERDRARDRALQAAGLRVVRVTWRQLAGEPEAVARDLNTLLTTSPARPRTVPAAGGIVPPGMPRPYASRAGQGSPDGRLDP